MKKTFKTLNRRYMFNLAAKDSGLAGLTACGLSRQSALGIVMAQNAIHCVDCANYDWYSDDYNRWMAAAHDWAIMARTYGAGYMVEGL